MSCFSSNEGALPIHLQAADSQLKEEFQSFQTCAAHHSFHNSRHYIIANASHALTLALHERKTPARPLTKQQRYCTARHQRCMPCLCEPHSHHCNVHTELLQTLPQHRCKPSAGMQRGHIAALGECACSGRRQPRTCFSRPLSCSAAL